MEYNHTIYAKAKVNLFLHITGKNEKSYHLLESLVCFTNDIYDIINVYKSNEFSLEIQGKFANQLPVQNNIILKAADFLRQGKNLGAKIILTKNLPIGAGIGGGSSDAASVIKLLGKLWNIPLNQEIVSKLLTLGADVPCCYYGSAAYFSGIGEVLDPVSTFPELYILLVNPNKPLLTSLVFNNLNTDYSVALENKPKNFSKFEELLNLLHNTKNDMEKTVMKILPEVSSIIKALKGERGCLIARMSGSGPTCFALFATEELAKKAYGNITNKFNWWANYSRVS